MTLVASDAHGRQLRSVTMAITPGHVDRVGSLDTISAVIPAAGVESLSVESNGQVVATRTRPKLAPRVRILAPRAGAKVGKGQTVVVGWSATNPEHLKLRASVDYSRDGGRTWRPIYIGPNRGQVPLPSIYFVGSNRARVRVRVNDGFNESVAVSGIFTAIGAPPLVAIQSPAKRTRLSGDARPVFAGTAYDQLFTQLAGRHLRWYAGPFLLGTGANPTASPLPPGRERIRLVATDSGGSAAASVVVMVTKLSLPYLRLKLPARVKPGAGTLTFTASSAAPSTLRIGRSTFRLARRSATFRLRVKPGRTPLLLELTAKIAGVAKPFAAVVSR